MTSKLAVDWSVFAQWELRMAHGKARNLIGKYGFTREDAEDIAQELLLVILRRRKVRKAWQKVSASKETVMSRILDNHIRDIIKSLNTDKRRVCTTSISLNVEILRPSDEETTSLEDLVGEDGIMANKRCTFAPTPAETEMEFSAMLSGFSGLQRRIIELRMAGFSMTDTARLLSISRSSLNRRIVHIRQLLATKDRLK